MGGVPYPRVQAATETDVAVVGGGAAGLYVALSAAEHGARVALISRKPLSESASYWAQGGLAAALAPDDSPARHADDTLNAGGAQTGRAITDRLAELVAAQGRVEVLEETSAIALWSDGERCAGVVADAG